MEEAAAALEEGKACYYEDDDGEHTSIDPDVALSYIDEKIQHVLGHFQKDFEGGVSVENLGAKFGGYGSFLPSYERSPLRPHPKIPQRNHKTPRSPENLLVEGATQNCTAPSNTTPYVRLGTASCSAKSHHITKVSSPDVTVKQDSCLFSTRIAEKSSVINENLNQSVNPTEQRKPKIRIKVADNRVRKNAAIYSGLGLDISPSSSLGNSPEVSGGMPPKYRETPDDSPASILQIMTFFPVPGGLLISPLHDSLLCLSTKEKLPGDRKPRPVPKDSQKNYSKLADGSASTERVVNGLKEKKTGSVEKSERLEENGNGIGFEDVITVVSKKKMENETLEGEKFMSKDLKLTLPSKSIFDVSASAKGTGRTYEISREANKDGLKGKLFSSDDLVKVDPLGSQESCKSEKLNANHSSVEKNFESKVANNQKGVPYDIRDESRCKSKKPSATFDADVSKHKGGLNAGATVPSKQKPGQKKTTSHEHNQITMPYPIGRELFESKKKSKGVHSNGKQAANVPEESSRIGLSVAPKDKHDIGNGVHPPKSKTHKLKSKKDNGKVRDHYNDFLGDKKIEQTDIRMDNLEGPLGNRPKDSNLDYVEKERNAFLDKSKEQSIGGKVEKQSIFGVSSKEAPIGGLPCTENGLISEMVPAGAAAVVIEEDWVGCDSCRKWRLLPYGTKPEQLPEKWLCKMLNWLPEMNRCDISEEETTKALHALYQCSVPEIQTNPLNPVNGHSGQNNQNPSSHSIANRENKKCMTEVITNADSSSGLMLISNSTKNRRQESVTSRSLKGMNKTLLESSLATKHLSKSCELDMGNHVSKQKEKHMDRGDVKQAKTKNKREADQYEYGYGESKKIKGSSAPDINWNSEKGEDFGRGELSLSSDFSTKATGKDMLNYTDVCSLKNSKCPATDRISVSVKKLGDQSQFSFDGGSLDLRTCDKRDVFLKKRKLEDWRDSQNHMETPESMGNSLPDSKDFKQEDIGSEFKEEKKSRASKAEEKESSTNKGGDRSKKEGRVTRIVLSVKREHLVDGMEEARGSKDRQVQRRKEKVTPPIFSDGVDLLNRDLGCGHVSMETTSSSSKVSGSSRSRSKVQEARGSPADSVLSSPLRTSNPGKVPPEIGENLRKCDAANGVMHVRVNLGRCLDGEGNDGSNLSGTLRKENDFGKHNESIENSTLDYQERVAKHKLDVKDKPSLELQSYLVNADVDRVIINPFCDNALIPQKSDEGFYLQSKDNDKKSTSDLDEDKMKVCNPLSEQEELHSKKSLKNDRDIDPHHTAGCKKKISCMKVLFPEKCSMKSSKDEKKRVRNKESVGNWSNDSSKENHLKHGDQDGSYVKLDAQCSKNGKFTPQQKLMQGTEGEKSSNGLLANKVDSVRIESEVGKSELFPYREGKKDTLSKGLRSVLVSQGGDVFNALPVGVSADAGVTRASKQLENADNQNRVHFMLEHPVPNRHMVKDLNASSPVRKDPSNQTSSNALKEAKDLQDLADSLKGSGFGFESSVAYFQAALKFLLAASLLETCNSDGGRHGEMTHMQVYSFTAKLCEFCAHEYEGRQEMAAAALAYKCMEVAYMRAVYCKHFTSSKDHHELQATLQMLPKGESPSSSASDVDNLNSQATADKAALSKGSGSHVAGHHVINARNRPNFIRLLDFTQDINLAMEASAKSQNAFAAANLILEEAHNKEAIAFVNRVVDFSFQDVEGLIRLVQLAVEAINR